MIKTPLSTVIGGAGIWTPGCTVIGGQQNLTQLIKSLFANSEVGFAYDPNDLSTLYQDAAGTIPVTTVGQPVGLMLDKSGRGNHAFATSSATRPILQRNATTGAYYLAFDGADDFLQTNSIDFTATDEVSLFVGVRKLSDANSAIVCEFSQNVDVNNGTFSLHAPIGNAVGNRFGGRSKGTSVAVCFIGLNESLYSAPSSTVLTMQTKIALNLLKMKSNLSSLIFSSLESQGAGNYGNYPLYIGRRGADGSRVFNGHLYSLIGIGRLTTDSETIALEKAIAKNTGGH